jgi:hypothetical protein
MRRRAHPVDLGAMESRAACRATGCHVAQQGDITGASAASMRDTCRTDRTTEANMSVPARPGWKRTGSATLSRSTSLT